MDRPSYFQDTMVRGIFRSFQHDHQFVEVTQGHTEMKDTLRFEAPVYGLGKIAELFLKPYLRRFLRERNAVIKAAAESDTWRSYLPADPF